MHASSYFINNNRLYNKIILSISLILFIGNFFTFLGGSLDFFRYSTLKNLYDNYNFYNLVEFFRTNYSAFTLIINIFFLITVSKIKFSKKEKVVAMIILLIFLPQLIGFFNNLITYKNFNTQSLTTMVQIINVAVNLIIISLIIDEKKLKYFYILILFALFFQFIIFFSNYTIFEIQYGGYELEISFGELSKKLYFNSNGLGRTATIFYIFFVIFFFETKYNHLKYFNLIFAIIFLIFIILLSGRFNSLALIITNIAVFFLYKKIFIKNWKKTFLVICFVVFSVENISNFKENNLFKDYTYDQIKTYKVNNKILRNITSSNLNRDEINTDDIIVKEFINQNKSLKALNNISTGRIAKWLYILRNNDKIFLGSGPNLDRSFFEKKIDFKGASDAASGIMYQYISSGILGVICLIFFYYKFYFIIKNLKFNNNYRYIYNISLLIFIILSFRICFEIGYTIFGIDLLLFLVSIVMLIKINKKII